MNKVNFQQPGGFPLKSRTMSFLQSAFGQLSNLAGLGGSNYILNGCTVTGGNVTDGIIVIDGEVLPFVGGPKLAHVIIEETVTNETFKDGTSKLVYYTRVAKTAAAGGVMDFDSLKRITSLVELKDSIVQQEVIKFTPVLYGNAQGSITDAKCYMFKMGKFVSFYGFLRYTWANNEAPIDGFGITGFPSFIAPTSPMGFCNVRVWPNDNHAVVEYNSSGRLDFRYKMSAGTYDFSFSINVFTDII
ncbi:hypothetical protein ACR79N_02315 [Sphingobacterium siyangense]|uniref:hypothetical protein n=1 Tax=Sphingobacterium siyangense TaxID=459529 RepID=UPI003DA3A8B1